MSLFFALLSYIQRERLWIIGAPIGVYRQQLWRSCKSCQNNDIKMSANDYFLRAELDIEVPQGSPVVAIISIEFIQCLLHVPKVVLYQFDWIVYYRWSARKFQTFIKLHEVVRTRELQPYWKMNRPPDALPTGMPFLPNINGQNRTTS